MLLIVVLCTVYMFPGSNLTRWMIDSTVKRKTKAAKPADCILSLRIQRKGFNPDNQLLKRQSALCFRAWPTAVIVELFLIFVSFFVVHKWIRD